MPIRKTLWKTSGLLPKMLGLFAGSPQFQFKFLWSPLRKTCHPLVINRFRTTATVKCIHTGKVNTEVLSLSPWVQTISDTRNTYCIGSADADSSVLLMFCQLVSLKIPPSSIQCILFPVPVITGSPNITDLQVVDCNTYESSLLFLLLHKIVA